MKRLFDVLVALLLLPIFIIPMIIISILVKTTSKGPILYWSKRVGKNNIIYSMPKFRSMLIDTPNVATHLLDEPDSFLTPIGLFIRRTSIDELPQLYSILAGKMSFVGPRPALFNQDDLISMRTIEGVNKLLPGITGWAQINGRDDISITEKVILDVEYMQRKSLWFDIKILQITFMKVITRDGVSH